MDIRNIKEIVPPLEVGTYLQAMYSLSLEQLDGYRQIESYRITQLISIITKIR